MEHVFVDTWAFVAQADRRDAWHPAAAEALTAIAGRGWPLVTSTDVVDEAVTAVSALLGGTAAVQFLGDLEDMALGDELVLIAITETRRAAGAKVFRRLAPDVPRLSLTDCTSFAVMSELGLKLALTGDQHFTRAGKGIRPLFVRNGQSLELRLP